MTMAESAKAEKSIAKPQELVQLIKINDGNGESCRPGAIATQDIKRGDVVFEELPYIFSLQQGNNYVHCYHCFGSLPKPPIKCRSCTYSKYCSTECEDISWTSGHHVECTKLEAYLRHFDFQKRPFVELTLKLMLKNTIARCLISARENDMSFSSEEYRQFDSTPYNSKDDEESPDWLKLKKGLNLLVAELLNIPDFSEFAPLKHDPSADDRTLLGSLLLKHFRQAQLITTKINRQELKTVSTLKEDFKVLGNTTIGNGLYLKYASLRHSCDPNTQISYFDRNHLVVRATRDIKAGDEVMVSYGPTFRSEPFKERQKTLREDYFVDCHCSACSQQLETNSQALLCPKCNGPVFEPLAEDEPTHCATCDETNTIEKYIVQEIETNIKLSKMGQLKLISKDINIRKAEHQLLLSHRYLASVLYPTNNELGVIKERLSYT